MPRPAGHKLNRHAWDDMLVIRMTTLTQVADAAEIPRPTLSAIVGQFNAASIPVAHKIAEALDVHPAHLFPTLSPSLVKAGA